MTDMNFDIRYKQGPAISTLMRQSLRKYIEHHELHSDSLRAILENNLKKTVWHADNTTYAQVPTIVTFLHWEAPAACHGSPEAVKAWLAGGNVSHETSEGGAEKWNCLGCSR